MRNRVGVSVWESRWPVLIAAALQSMLIGGCPRDEHLTIRSVDAAGVPTLCLSRGANCDGDPIGGLIVVERVREEGGRYIGEDAWFIKTAPNGGTRVITYGAVPDGYEEVRQAKPFEVGADYRIGHNYFRIDKAGDHYIPKTSEGKPPEH